MSGFNFYNIVADFKDRNIESSATEIIYSDGVIFIFIQAIS